MLVPLAIGLWIFSLVCDLIHLRAGADAVWATVAFYTMGGGIVGALLAAVPGLIDLLSLPFLKNFVGCRGRPWRPL
jgi:uncharacterized membrane protein